MPPQVDILLSNLELTLRGQPVKTTTRTSVRRCDKATAVMSWLRSDKIHLTQCGFLAGLQRLPKCSTEEKRKWQTPAAVLVHTALFYHNTEQGCGFFYSGKGIQELDGALSRWSANQLVHFSWQVGHEVKSRLKTHFLMTADETFFFFKVYESYFFYQHATVEKVSAVEQFLSHYKWRHEWRFHPIWTNVFRWPDRVSVERSPGFFIH